MYCSIAIVFGTCIRNPGKAGPPVEEARTGCELACGSWARVCPSPDSASLADPLDLAPIPDPALTLLADRRGEPRLTGDHGRPLVGHAEELGDLEDPCGLSLRHPPNFKRFTPDSHLLCRDPWRGGWWRGGLPVIGPGERYLWPIAPPPAA